MTSRSLPDEQLRSFLRRSRKGSGLVDLPPLGSFLAQTLELAARLVPSAAGSLHLDDPVNRRDGRSPLTLVATFGSGNEELLGIEVRPGEGIIGNVYSTGETFRAQYTDSSQPLVRFKNSGQLETRSIIATPVLLEKHVCGVLELINRKECDQFSDRDADLVELLSGYISRAILNAVDILKQNELAKYDPLTGLRNIRGLNACLDAEVEVAESNHADTSVLFIDLDRLKAINDQFGHHVGSEAIRRAAAILQKSTSSRGHVFRFGGDEFVVVAPNMDLADAESFAKELVSSIEVQTARPSMEANHSPALTVSIGVASFPECLRLEVAYADTPGRRLLGAADRALYRAKHAGRNQVCVASVEDDEVHNVQLESIPVGGSGAH